MQAVVGARCRPPGARTAAASARRATIVSLASSHRWQPGLRVERRRASCERRPSPGIRDTGAGSRKRAAEAIIAALSVQSSRATSFRRRPRSRQSPPTRSRSSAFAATPAAERHGPPRARVEGRARAWRPAGRRRPPGSSPPGRRDADRSPRRPSSRTAYSSAVFRPLKLKSRPGSRVIATGKRTRPGSPSAAGALDRRAARVAEPEQPGALVERLPAASSSVCPSTS